MKALVLTGGRGTRLRPLTLRTPKPLLPVVNRPFLRYQLDVLAEHVDEAVLCAADPKPFRKALGERVGRLRLRYASEDRPLGTGGAVKNASRWLDGEARFLVLNGDVLNALDIGAFVKAHRRSGARVSIAISRVPDPTLYGLVRVERGGSVREFVEKPSPEEVDVNTVNAGAYVFERSVLEELREGPSSLERELFPALLQRGGLAAFESKGYWIDIGTLDRYLQVHLDLLGGRTGLARPKTVPSLDGGHVALGEGTRIDPTARFSGNVSIGARCRVAAGAMLRDCVLLEGARIGPNARVERCVVGPGCEVGERAELLRATALAGGSRVEAYSHL